MLVTKVGNIFQLPIWQHNLALVYQQKTHFDQSLTIGKIIASKSGNECRQQIWKWMQGTNLEMNAGNKSGKAT